MTDVTQPLIHTIRGLRAKVAAETLTLDEAATQLVAASEMTMVGARDILARPSADVEAHYLRERRIATSGLEEMRDRGE